MIRRLGTLQERRSTSTIRLSPCLTTASGAPLVHSWRSDRPEYWLLVNDSKECHNFHIHQTKFEVAASHVARDQTGESQDQCLGDRDPSKLASRTALHDNFPLPPGARILLRIAFGPDQLGRFVFHCHILEHEDKGMMSLLQVEERDSQGAPRAAAAFPASDASTADAAAGHRKGRKASAAIPRRP
ncbi:multicopper oxidase domain-containing protein [Methylocystis sp.]|uniref:multicopper oxidase domain-containing protein n=1 Tax=Methylocystis sp. TaxID=1911079 RepID=UPI003D152D2E